MTYTRKNVGVCSRFTEVTLNEQGIIENVAVEGGCNGNLKGICSLLKGLTADEAIARMKGLTCGNKATSCPDQIAITLQEAKAKL